MRSQLKPSGNLLYSFKENFCKTDFPVMAISVPHFCTSRLRIQCNDIEFGER